MVKVVPENMVLRTVYLPKALDNRLRDRAFRLQVSKGEYIRTVVELALNKLDAEGDHGLDLSSVELAPVPVAAAPQVPARERAPVAARSAVKARSTKAKSGSRKTAHRQLERVAEA